MAPTIPVGFNFRTESRLAKHGPARPAEGARGESPGVFARKLRSYNNPAGQGKGQVSKMLLAVKQGRDCDPLLHACVFVVSKR